MKCLPIHKQLDTPTAGTQPTSTDLPIVCQYILRRLAQSLEKRVLGVSPQALAIIEGYPWASNLPELERILASAVQQCRGRVILPAHLDLELPAPSQAPLLPFVDLALLSGRHGDETTDDAQGSSRARAFHILRRRGVSSPTIRRELHPNCSVDATGGVPTETSSTAQSASEGTPPHPQAPLSIRPLREALDEMESQLIAQALRAADHDLSKAAELLCIPRQTLQYRMKALGVPPKA